MPAIPQGSTIQRLRGIGALDNVRWFARPQASRLTTHAKGNDMTRKEAQRQARQEQVLLSLGFTSEEAASLRRISMTLRRWHELECGDGNGCIERDEASGIPQWRMASDTGRLAGRPIPDRETGAKKRLLNIINAHASRSGRALAAYIQTDPRGAALYILRPGDVPAGADVGAYYNRGICVY